MQLPSFVPYCEGTNPINALRFDYGTFTIWYSYRTPVAFRSNGVLHVRENSWGPTTGRHLNQIDAGDKPGRLPGAEFEKLLSKACCERNDNEQGSVAERGV